MVIRRLPLRLVVVALFACAPGAPDAPEAPEAEEAPEVTGTTGTTGTAETAGDASRPAGQTHPLLLQPDDPAWDAQAPDTFHARFETTEGPVVLEVVRAWAPHGADRFYNLVRHGFYDDMRLSRIREGFIAQWGLNGDPEVMALWHGNAIPDDPVRTSNVRGTVAFAMTGPDTRDTQVYVNLDDNVELDDQGFAPFARVAEGMDVVEAWYAGYGEEAGGGMRAGQQGPVLEQGNAWLDEHFPLLDRIVTARVIP